VPVIEVDRSAPPEAGAVLLRLAGVWKRFPGVEALKGVSFEARAGEVHALLGENGAGKSTLMAVASGSIVPDSGSIELAGWQADSLTPSAALRHGLAIVRQQPALLPDLTVAENLEMGVPRELRPASVAGPGWAGRALERYGLRIDVHARVDDLSVAERQLVELAKALALEPRVLVLDEPTAALTPDMVALVFDQVRLAAARGAAVVYISHRLPEVREIAERVTVMRDGEVRATSAVEAMSDSEILRLIVGRPVSMAFPPKTGPAGGDGAGLMVRELSGPRFHGVTLAVAPGEIVGLAGIAGNGQSDVLRALAGLAGARGEATLAGRPLRLGRPSPGVAYLSADRHGEGLLMSLSVRENAALASLDAFGRFGVVRRREEIAAVEREREALAIRTPSLESAVSALSGGNQQKVVMARALLAKPSLLLADEPTQGVDAGARMEIYRILRDASREGVPMLVVSSDGLELQGLCDRVVIFSRGQVVGELSGDDVTEERIAHAIVTANVQGREAARRTRELGPRHALGGRLRRFASGDYAPGAVLLLVMAALAAYTALQNEHYFSAFNVSSMLTLLAALAFISLGQITVILTGGIDISVGPLTGLVVVVASFFVEDGRAPLIVAGGFALMLVVALVTGLCNGALVRVGRFTPVAATLATYIGLQGLSLLLRPFQAGYISGAVIDAVQATVGVVPVAFIAAVALAVVLEVCLRRTWWGLHLRAAGSSERAAHQLGVRVNVVVAGAYVACSALTFLGGIMLMAQVGIGDPTQGVTYTLSSITAVVLGGASLFGGRGAYVGALLGAALIQQITNATTFLNLSQAWQYWLLGLLTLAGAVIYSQARRARRTE
jgi:ribose transport system ATP-binding protein